MSAAPGRDVPAENLSFRGFFQRCYEHAGQAYAFRGNSIQDARQWAKDFRKRLWEVLALDRLQEMAGRTQLFGGILSHREEDGFVRVKYALETLHGVTMPFYVLVPEGKGIYPAAIALPAHGANKDSVAGVRSDPAVAKKLRAHPEEAYGLSLVRKGFVVLCPDPPGYGERRELCSAGARDPLGTSCRELAETAETLGLTLTGLAVWELMRLTDVAAALPMVDARRIASVGFSGGGQYSMWLAAMDERIAAAVISGYVHGYGDCLMASHLCPCNFVPGLWQLADLSDICSLIAPRPLYVENGLQDPLSGPMGIAGPARQAERIRTAYRVCGREDNFRFATPEGGHRWHGGGIPFLVETLGSK